jgi:L-asparaginase II
MADPISVAVARGDTIESMHRVHAVAVTRGGEVVAAAGEPGLVTFMRSAAKPLQALPLVRALPDLDDAEIAIACASHLAGPEQLAAVRSLLARAGADEDDLECGPAGEPPSRLEHNCSGKHAGMLALCSAHGWSTPGYRLPEHPVQAAMLAELETAAGIGAPEIPTAVDGCGVVTFALPLERMARAFAQLERLDGGALVAAAMRAHPELIRGRGAPDTELMRALPGWIAKGGAEALLCASSPDGVGVAVKVEDGGARAVGPALATFLATLGHAAPELGSRPVRNSRGEVVGEIRSSDL